MTHAQSCPDHSTYRRGCEPCRRQAREYQRGVRARSRRLKLEPAPVVDAPAAPVGAAVAAVRASLATLGELCGYEWAAAAAVAIARILDHPGAVTTQPAAAKQLGALMDMLHKEAGPKQGRLAAVQRMSRSSRPDAG